MPRVITIFPHIPRSGGTTLRRLMDVQFSGRVRRCGTEYFEDLALCAQQLGAQDVRAWYGHHPYGLHAHLSGPCQYITLLRDPVARICSIWQRRSRRCPELTLCDVAEGAACYGQNAQPETRNMAVRILSGAGLDEQLDSWHLARAEQNLLNHFIVVGDPARYRAFACTLRDQLGWHTVDPNNLPRENAFEHQKKPVPPEQIEELQQCSALTLDLALYRWVSKRMSI